MMKSKLRVVSNATTIGTLSFLLIGATLPCFSQVSLSQRVKRTVLVSIADRRLAVIENGQVLAYFPVAVGADVSPSPTGEFEIVNRVAEPAYYHAGVVMGPGANNPVGTRWIGLNLKGYGIHGTNAPRSIGQAASHGCIRLRNRDVENLYTMLRVGDVVQIRGERDEEVAAVFGGIVDVAEVETEQVGGESE
jgi:lipoprotein-anchoring transpeptidase ErfK/SrfK